MSNVVELIKRPVARDLSSNVTSFQNANNLALAEKQNKPNDNLFFPVSLRKLEDIAPGFDGMGQQAVVREDTGQILKVHGARYKLIKNEDVYSRVDELIRKAMKLDTNGMTIKDQIAYAGGRSMRTYTFPEHQVKVNSGALGNGLGDITQLRLNVINSYNGDTNLRINMGGYRLICLNGMVVGETFGSFRSTHTSGFNPAEIAPRIAASLDNFLQVGEKWKHWASTPCSPEQAAQAISKLVGKSESLYNKLITFWHNESTKMGATMWSLFNALTFWSTHYDISAGSMGNSSAIIQAREAKVAQVLQLPMFREAA